MKPFEKELFNCNFRMLGFINIYLLILKDLWKSLSNQDNDKLTKSQLELNLYEIE